MSRLKSSFPAPWAEMVAMTETRQARKIMAQVYESQEAVLSTGPFQALTRLNATMRNSSTGPSYQYVTRKGRMAFTFKKRPVESVIW